MRKAPAYAEIYNDLDGDVVNLFRLLRSEEAPRLLEQLELTPFSRAEFEASYTPAETSLERARKLVVRSFMGFGSDAPNIELRTGFRAQSPLSGRSPEKDWRNYPDALRLIIDRLRNVVVECRPAIEVMRRNDAPDTLHYVDPPYMPETRSIKSGRGRLKYHAYAHELDVGGAYRVAPGAARSRWHGRSLRLSVTTLRARAERLATRRGRSARRWRPPSHGSPLAQSLLLIRSRSGSRGRDTICRYGGANSMTHYRNPLSQQQINDARRRLEDGERMAHIARRLHVRADWLKGLIDTEHAEKRRRERRESARRSRKKQAKLPPILHPAVREPRVEVPQDVLFELKRAHARPQSVSAFLLGDPLPGRSALDRMQQQ
jgi:hypothetical protein